jgi:hypothetical protein
LWLRAAADERGHREMPGERRVHAQRHRRAAERRLPLVPDSAAGRGRRAFPTSCRGPAMRPVISWGPEAVRAKPDQRPRPGECAATDPEGHRPPPGARSRSHGQSDPTAGRPTRHNGHRQKSERSALIQPAAASRQWPGPVP